MATYSPKLPGYNLTDGDQILDNNGIVWEWNEEKGEWLNKGKIETIPDVSEVSDGLVTPEVKSRLDLLRELIDNGYKFNKFKLRTDVDNPYYYLFHSSDDLIRFIPEGPSRLRIEVDQSRLYQKLLRNVCLGPKGEQGPTGNTGRAGSPADNEQFKLPTVEGNIVNLSEEVASPIDTPISLRFYDSDDQEVADVRIPLSPTEPVDILTVEGISVEETGTVISYEDEVLNATVVFTGQIDDIDEWRYKARQVGPTGSAGVDGDSFIEIVNELLPDPSIYSTSALVSARKSGESNVVYLGKELFESIVVSRLSATAGALPPSNLLEAKFVAAEVTTRSNKSIGMFEMSKTFKTPQVDTPNIDLPSWTPPSGCGQGSRWSAFRFNWWDYADVDYIFRIVPTRRPPDKCCEQDFFWCPNVGDQPCGIQGAFGRAANIEMPKKFEGDCICECENPIDFELQSGGFVFDPITTTDSAFEQNSAVMVAQDSVLDGSADRFYCDITMDQPIKVTIKLEQNSNVCGGEAKERRGCAFRDGRQVHMTAVMQDLSGGVEFMTPQVVESEKFPGSVEFKVDTSKFKDSDGVETNVEAKARLVINVNDTFINLCRGYRLSVKVVKGRFGQA